MVSCWMCLMARALKFVSAGPAAPNKPYSALLASRDAANTVLLFCEASHTRRACTVEKWFAATCRCTNWSKHQTTTEDDHMPSVQQHALLQGNGCKEGPARQEETKGEGIGRAALLSPCCLDAWTRLMHQGSLVKSHAILKHFSKCQRSKAKASWQILHRLR